MEAYMSRYSELLRERIENSGYKDAELAGEIGIDRTYLVKNKNGTAVLKDVKKAETLFSRLSQTDEEERELYDSYYEVLYGDKRHNMNLAVKEFLSSFHNVSELKATIIQKSIDVPNEKSLAMKMCFLCCKVCLRQKHRNVMDRSESLHNPTDVV